VRVTVLASGSSGNAALFESTGTSILVDAGVGPRVLEQALTAIGARLPDAIVVTHAHLDHVGHAARIARRRHIPVYLTEATAREVRLPGEVEEFRFGTRDPFAIGDLVVAPLPVPHDAANVALTISDDSGAATLATDVGEPTARLVEHLQGSDIVLLESNHDEGMLHSGPYPLYLQRRVASARGHLSNRQACAVLRKLSPQTHTVVLMHLSGANNTPALASEEARESLPSRVALHVAPVRGTLRLVSRSDASSATLGLEHESAPSRSRRPVQLSLLG
jgi:phosphoribosyl 1,2-cyclic phosphodiesterase